MYNIFKVGRYMKDIITLRCPVCNQEYLPSEVFYPEAVFGKQYDITKDNEGTIKFYLGDDPEYDEEFVCDSCMTKLKVHMKMAFDIEIDDNKDFEEEYETKLNKPKKIKLKEEELF